MKTIPFFSLLFSILLVNLSGETITAKVSNIDVPSKTFTLRHIQSNNSAQSELDSLEVKVGNGDAQLAYTGKKIRGNLSMSDGKYRLEQIWPIDDEESEKRMQLVNQLLATDSQFRKKQNFRKKKDPGINFAMWDQNGAMVEWDQFKGDWILMNFIFTRCRVQEMCPAQTARMIELQREAKALGIKNLQQLSITFDPGYDTPGILYEYATNRGADLNSFSFLTGSDETLMALLKEYGVIAWESKNIIDHTVTTLLFDKSGTIAIRKDGPRWNLETFLRHIVKAEKN